MYVFNCHVAVERTEASMSWIRNPPLAQLQSGALPFCPSQLEPRVRLLACEVGVGARGQKLRFRRVVASTSVSMKSVAPLARLCARTVRARVAAPCVVGRHPAPVFGWNGNITVMATRASGVSAPTTTRWCSTNDGGSGILVTATDEQLEVYPPSDETRARANISSEEEYKRLWQLSVGTCYSCSCGSGKDMLFTLQSQTILTRSGATSPPSFSGFGR